MNVMFGRVGNRPPPGFKLKSKMAGEKKEAVGNGVNKTVGNVETAAFGGDVIPNVVKIGIGLRCAAVSHLPRRLLLGDQAGTTAPLCVLGKLSHGFLRDNAPFTPCQRNFRLVDGHQDFQSPALPLLPQGQCLLHRVFLTAKPSALNCLADERFLIGGELHFHTFSA